MTIYRLNFKKIVYGYAYVNANSIEEAQAKMEDGQYDEEDVNSEYEWEDKWRE